MNYLGIRGAVVHVDIPIDIKRLLADRNSFTLKPRSDIGTRFKAETFFCARGDLRPHHSENINNATKNVFRAADLSTDAAFRSSGRL